MLNMRDMVKQGPIHSDTLHCYHVFTAPVPYLAEVPAVGLATEFGSLAGEIAKMALAVVVLAVVVAVLVA
jgi:hypothetical protein